MKSQRELMGGKVEVRCFACNVRLVTQGRAGDCPMCGAPWDVEFMQQDEQGVWSEPGFGLDAGTVDAKTAAWNAANQARFGTGLAEEKNPLKAGWPPSDWLSGANPANSGDFRRWLTGSTGLATAPPPSGPPPRRRKGPVPGAKPRPPGGGIRLRARGKGRHGFRPKSVLTLKAGFGAQRKPQ